MNRKLKITTPDVVILTLLLALAAYVVYRLTMQLNYKWNWGILPQYFFYIDEETGRWVAIAGPRRIPLALGIRLALAHSPPRPASRRTGQRDAITPPVTLSGALPHQQIYGAPVFHGRLSMMPRPPHEW